MRVFLPEVDYLYARINECLAREGKSEIFLTWELFDKYGVYQESDIRIVDLFSIQRMRFVSSALTSNTFLCSQKFLDENNLGVGYNVVQIHDTFYEVDRILQINIETLTVKPYIDFKFETHLELTIFEISFIGIEV